MGKHGVAVLAGDPPAFDDFRRVPGEVRHSVQLARSGANPDHRAERQPEGAGIELGVVAEDQLVVLEALQALGDRRRGQPDPAAELGQAQPRVLGVAWLRIVSAAAIFAVWRRPWRAFAALDRSGRWLLMSWGAVLATMNGCFYEAISRLALGTVAAIEFLPVVGLAALGARTWRNLTALGLTVAGVYLLTYVRLHGGLIAFGFAFINAALFAVYIMLADRVAKRPELSGLDGLAAAMLIAAALITPVGAGAAAPALIDPKLLLPGVGIGIASSVIPYVTDQFAMARLPRATYALMVSLLPAIATIIGMVVLSQIPRGPQISGVVMVIGGVAAHREPRHQSGGASERSTGRSHP